MRVAGRIIETPKTIEATRLGRKLDHRDELNCWNLWDLEWEPLGRFVPTHAKIG